MLPSGRTSLRVVSELIAVRRARLLSMLVLALAMLVAGIGAAMQAQGTRVDTVLLFSSIQSHHDRNRVRPGCDHRLDEDQS